MHEKQSRLLMSKFNMIWISGGANSLLSEIVADLTILLFLVKFM